MDWTKWSDPLKQTLKLTTEPIAITFTGRPEAASPAAHGKVSVCQALKRAAEGESLTVTVETCGCPGGLVSLGLGQMPASGKEKLVDFLVEKEKVYCSRLAIHRGQEVVSPPAGMASHVLFRPLAQAETLPDLVTFIGTPGSLYELLTLLNYWEGRSMKAELAGPACRTGVAYPVATGEVGISLFDSGARRLGHFADDQLMVSVPFHRVLGLIHALEQGVGRRKEETLEAAERQIDELGPVEAV